MKSVSHNENLQSNTNDGEANTVETPIKKNKVGFHSNLKTAETPNMQLSASKQTIADIDAEELFNNFSRIVSISQSLDQFQSNDLYRKLQYGQENIKLDFNQSTNSMRKKCRDSRLLPGQEGECIKVKPFLLDQGFNQGEQKLNLNEQKNIQNKKKSQDQGLSPLVKKQYNKKELLSTPTKKLIHTSDLQKAAKKECIFRDLKQRRNLFC